MRLADSPVLPFEFEPLRVHHQPLYRTKSTTCPASLRSRILQPSRSEILRLQKTAADFNTAYDRALLNLGSAPARETRRAQRHPVPHRARPHADPGLPGRPWYRHRSTRRASTPAMRPRRCRVSAKPLKQGSPTKRVEQAAQRCRGSEMLSTIAIAQANCHTESNYDDRLPGAKSKSPTPTCTSSRPRSSSLSPNRKGRTRRRLPARLGGPRIGRISRRPLGRRDESQQGPKRHASSAAFPAMSNPSALPWNGIPSAFIPSS